MPYGSPWLAGPGVPTVTHTIVMPRAGSNAFPVGLPTSHPRNSSAHAANATPHSMMPTGVSLSVSGALATLVACAAEKME